jgi:tetratricopeptide (TPR) repeat protein
MCGGMLNIQENETIIICDYCGTKQTIPKLDSEFKANLYDRANHFRRNNEYDKAMAIYEQILNEENTDAESYWSILLCRYGIEYVEDPVTHKRIPTVNRVQYTSIYADENYKSALKHADSYQREIYEEEAKAIDEIQKNFLSISHKESPFDVFICYKETDDQGRRTVDSVLANELYHQLTLEGYKVFFSRITLEDKLGSAYEPYIFSALNTAKVMVVLGTRTEYFKSVWVKNEWSRYLTLIKGGTKKMLIPAYKNMDPYDLPEEFSHLQALDMSKLGFMQDLIRGIKKILFDETMKKKTKEDDSVRNNTNNSLINPLLKRAMMSLEDGEYQKVDDLCEQVLNQDPENATAYLYKMMSELHVSKFDDLAKVQTRLITNDIDELFKDVAYYVVEEGKCSLNKITQVFGIGFNRATQIVNDLEKYGILSKNFGTEARKVLVDFKVLHEILNQEIEYDFESNNNFKKIIRYGDQGLVNKLNSLNDMKLYNRKQKIYEQAKKCFDSEDFESAINFFKTISGFKDSDELKAKCLVKKENANKEAIYLDAKRKVNFFSKISDIEEAIRLLESIPGYKDSDLIIEQFKLKIDEIKIKEKKRERIEEEQRIQKIAKIKRYKKMALIVISFLAIIITFLIVLFT